MNKYQYKVQGVDYDVEIEEVEGNLAKVSVNGIAFEVELKQPINPARAITKPKVATPTPTPKQTCCCSCSHSHTCCTYRCWFGCQGSTAWHHRVYMRKSGRQG